MERHSRRGAPHETLCAYSAGCLFTELPRGGSIAAAGGCWTVHMLSKEGGRGGGVESAGYKPTILSAATNLQEMHTDGERCNK